MQASEIKINLESDGRLEYNQDDAGNPDILLDTCDLRLLQETVIKYETNVRQKWLLAFQHNGINFDNNHTAKLQSSGLTWDKLTVYQLSEGLKNLPQSWCKDVQTKHKNLTVFGDDNSVEAVSPLNITGAVQYKLTIPKGWRKMENVVDLTDIYRKAMSAWTDLGFQDEHAEKKYHIHSKTEGATHVHPYNYVCSNYASDKSTSQSPGGCYQIPVIHHHTGDTSYGGGCYTAYIYHKHKGNEHQQGACFPNPLYHMHSTSSDSETSTTPNAGPTGLQDIKGGCFQTKKTETEGFTCTGTLIVTQGNDGNNHTLGYCTGDPRCAANEEKLKAKGISGVFFSGGDNWHGKTHKEVRQIGAGWDGVGYVPAGQSTTVTKWELSCTKNQSSILCYEQTCTKSEEPSKYSYKTSLLGEKDPDDSYGGYDCPYSDGKTIKYACTDQYPCNECETFGEGTGCGKRAHQLLSMTVTY